MAFLSIVQNFQKLLEPKKKRPKKSIDMIAKFSNDINFDILSSSRFTILRSHLQFEGLQV
jgi:hypothetical protein